MSRIIKSKFYKPFISLLVAVILVFSYEVSKPKAIVPIVIWGAGILAGVVAEEMLEMGIKHVTDTGKTTGKSKTKKIADAVLDSLESYDFDNTKPTRKADGSLEVNLSANDRAKIARKIADEFGDMFDTATEDKRFTDNSNTYVYENDDGTTADPFYSTSLNLEIKYTSTSPSESFLKGTDLLKKYYSVSFQPVAFRKEVIMTFKSSVDGSETKLTVIGGTKASPQKYIIYGNYTDDGTNNPNFQRVSAHYTLSNLSSTRHYGATAKAYQTYLKVLQQFGKKIYYADGLAIPETIKNVYSVGEDYDDDNLPNRNELSNKPYKIPNYFPPSESDNDVEWEMVQQHYDNDVTNNQTKIDNEYETYLENGDINNTTNTYNTQNINNYYTDTNYPVKNGEIKIDIDIDNDNTVVVPGDDDGGGVADGESAPVIDRTLITYAKQTYDYLGDSIDGAIVSMRDITDDASGLVDYLDTSFRWLPAEWRALFGSAFILGVFAHFMRR